MKFRPMSLFLLPQTGLIRASGADARAFLQSQLTNDTQAVTPERGQLSGYCSPKGRLLAVFTVLNAGPDTFVLALPAPLVAATLKRLKLYVLRSRVVLEEISDLAACGSLGNHPGAPEEPWASQVLDGALWLRRPGTPHHLVVAPTATAAENPAAAAEWVLAEVSAGLPTVLPETLDAFVPQTVDLDLAGGISFTKGCYPGQEIVARVHYLGRVKQRLFHARAATAPAPGSPVLDAEGANVGTVMVAAAAEGGSRLLAVLPVTTAGSLLLADGTALSGIERAHADAA